jgi:hypothetical protein
MKPPIAVLGLAGSFLSVTLAAFAQDGPAVFGRRGAATAPAPADAPSKVDQKVFPAGMALPAPTPIDQLKAPTMVLPNDPIEPWLLTKDVGPFLVIAKTFRGPEAERYALALAKELRSDWGLPAHILRTKDFPMRSNIRNVPPTAPAYLKASQLTQPEKTRNYDEAAVLVGDEKTLDDSEALLKRVKKIRPKCLGAMPGAFGWRQGLNTAIRTTNPYVPTQNIFPGRGKRDHLLTQMNGGPRSVYRCPGRYSLQVAEFGGRAVFNPTTKDASFFDKFWQQRSPLATAADDAERLAEALSKDPEVQRTGCQPYVYHSRTSSKVMVGSFNDPNDPAAARLRQTLVEKVAAPVVNRKKEGMVIAPATALTDLEDPNRPVKTLQ